MFLPLLIRQAFLANRDDDPGVSIIRASLTMNAVALGLKGVSHRLQCPGSLKWGMSYRRSSSFGCTHG
jgi:hypothetical protein